MAHMVAHLQGDIITYTAGSSGTTQPSSDLVHQVESGFSTAISQVYPQGRSGSSGTSGYLSGSTGTLRYNW